jgi:hypothetical protein
VRWFPLPPPTLIARVQPERGRRVEIFTRVQRRAHGRHYVLREPRNIRIAARAAFGAKVTADATTAAEATAADAPLLRVVVARGVVPEDRPEVDVGAL